MNIRRATEADAAAVKELWDAFDAEIPEPRGFEHASYEESTVVYVAEEDGIVGALEASVVPTKRWHIDTVYVVPHARGQGVVKALLAACVRDARADGAEWISLEVLTANEAAHAVWRKLGFEPVEIVMAQPLADLEAKLEAKPKAASRASTHVQTDDTTSVERAIAQFVPRLESPDVRTVENGWIRIADKQFDDDRDAQARFARELSDRLGAVVVALSLEQGEVVRFRLYERGRMVDEYLSVPSYYGEISRGDELALAANPTLVARLTGADRDEVRRVARAAASTAELPPAVELYEQVARMMRLEP